MVQQSNVLGEPLQPCSTAPATGYLRDGYCSACPGDRGQHTICATVTAPFLAHSKSRGNDLVTPRPDLGFPGLKPGDRWCLCISRWIEAHDAGCAPPVHLDATHLSALEFIDLETLRRYADSTGAGGDPGR